MRICLKKKEEEEKEGRMEEEREGGGGGRREGEKITPVSVEIAGREEEMM